MYISLETSEPLSDADRRVLAALLEAGVWSSKQAPSKVTPLKAVAKEPEPEPDAQPAPPPPATPTPTPVPSETGTGATMADAVALATKVVNRGATAEVKDVLTSLGVERISELSGDNIQAFVDRVSLL